MLHISHIRLSLVPLLFLFLILSACGGGGGGGSSNLGPPEIRTGMFIDSSVAGIKYQTPTQSGITSLNGGFTYKDGESVTFSIGGIDLPSTPAQAILTPLNLLDTSNYDDTAVINIARLLQTLDKDGDASYGITIAEDAHTYAAGMSLDFGASSFESDVADLVANSGSSNTALIDGATAISHLKTTIGNIKNNSPWKVAQPHTHGIDFSGLSFNWHCSDLNIAACEIPVWGVMRIKGVMLEHSETVDRLGWYDDYYNCQPTISISLNGEAKQIKPGDDFGAVAWFPVPDNKSIWCAAHTNLKVNQNDPNSVVTGSNPIDRFLEFSCSDKRAIPSGSSLDVSLHYADALSGGVSGNYDCQGFLGQKQHNFSAEFEGEGYATYPMGTGPIYAMSPPNGNSWAVHMDMDLCTDYGSDTKPYCQSITVIGNGNNLPIQTGTYQGANEYWVDVDATTNTVSHYYGSSSCAIYAGYTLYEYLDDGIVKETDYDENGIANGLDENGFGEEVFATYPIADFETALVEFMNTGFTFTTEQMLPICDGSTGGGGFGPGLPPTGLYVSNGTHVGAFDWVLDEGLTVKYYQQNTLNEVDCVHSEGYDIIEYLGDGTINVTDYGPGGISPSTVNYTVQFYETEISANYNNYYTLTTASLPPICTF